MFHNKTVQFNAKFLPWDTGQFMHVKVCKHLFLFLIMRAILGWARQSIKRTQFQHISQKTVILFLLIHGVLKM